MHFYSLPKSLIICGIFALSGLSILYPTPVHAIVQAAKATSSPVSYYKDISVFKSSLKLEISSTPRYIPIPEKIIQARLDKFKDDVRIEPIQITVIPSDDKILELSEKIAKQGSKLQFANYLRKNVKSAERVPGADLRLVTIDQGAFSLLDMNSFEEIFAKEHEELTIRTTALQQDPKSRDQLLSELAAYLSANQLRDARQKIAKGAPLAVDEDLLPPFARKMVRRHTAFRGPNCFHAALSFQSPLFPKSSFVNVREEAGYHRSMINYDELWRSVNLYFYEINPSTTDLQYGDMILFFDTPKTAMTDVDFHTLRHAATYLFGGYVFAKGSKSANTPYLIRTLSDEWDTWTKYTDDLGVKVFRRNLKHVKKATPWDPTDWMY